MRLIDADKRIARYCEENCGCTRQECTLTYEHDGCEACTFVQEIEDEPSVDAEPVRHGRWETKEYTTEDSFDDWIVIHHEEVCSECGKGQGERSKFCPHCGAKMDEGEQNAAN